MARFARLVIPEVAHHIIQKGNCGQRIFNSDADRTEYLSLILEYGNKYNTAIWAYCLMDNHVHFIAVPQLPDSFSKTFSIAHMRYSQYYNQRKKQSGHLWQGRFYSTPLDRSHLYEAIRYVETNPIRAGIVKLAEEYQWSSAKSHITGSLNPLLSDGLEKELEIDNWKHYLSKCDEVLVNSIRKKTGTGRPAGDQAFVSFLEKKTGRSLTIKSVGRKRKSIK